MENIQHQIWISHERYLDVKMQEHLNMHDGYLVMSANSLVRHQLYIPLVHTMWRQLRVRTDNFFNNR